MRPLCHCALWRCWRAGALALLGALLGALRTAELSRTWIKSGACGAAGPACAGLCLGRPARRTPGHATPARADHSRHCGKQIGTALVRRSLPPKPDSRSCVMSCFSAPSRAVGYA
jgi:hypothetical protein